MSFYRDLNDLNLGFQTCSTLSLSILVISNPLDNEKDTMTTFMVGKRVDTTNISYILLSTNLNLLSFIVLFLEQKRGYKSE